MANEISNYSEETKKRKSQYPVPSEPNAQEEVQAAAAFQSQQSPGAMQPTQVMPQPQATVKPVQVQQNPVQIQQQSVQPAVPPVDNSVNNNQQGTVSPQAQGAATTPPVAPVGMVGREQDAQWQPQNLNTIYPAPDVVPQKVGRPQEDNTQGGNVEGGDNDVNNNNNVDANTTNNVNNETNAGDTGQKPNEISTNTTTEVDDPTDYYADGYRYQWKHDPKRESNFQRQMQSDGLAGNVRHGNRRMVTAEEFAKAGWKIGDTPKDYTDTLWGIDVGVGKPKMNKKRQYVKDKNGEYVFADKLYMTPIRNDGKVMSPDELENYELSLYDKANGDVAKMIELDKVKNGGHGLILGRNMSDEQKRKLMRAHMTYYTSPGYETLYKNAQRNIANVPYNALAEFKKRVDEQLKGKPQDSWDVYTQAYYNAVVDAMREADAAPEEGENGKNTTSTPTATKPSTTAKPAVVPAVEKGTTSTATATTSTPPASTPAAGTETVDYSKDPLYTRYYDMYNGYDDEKLKKLLAQHEGRDGKGHKVAVALCRDILASRAAVGSTPKKEETKTPAEGTGTVTEDATDVNGNTDTEGDDTEEDYTPEDIEKTISELKMLSEDENATKEARETYKKALAEWEAKLNASKQKPSSGDGGASAGEGGSLSTEEEKQVSAYKDLYKDFSDETLKVMKRASEGVDPLKLRAINEIIEGRKSKPSPSGVSSDGTTISVKRRPRPKLEEDEGYQTASEAVKRAEEEYKAALAKERPYSVALKARTDKEKAEGLDAESEERYKKRQRTSRLIANIGDVLQGFANIAGTWYGAKSQNLSSLSGAVGARQKEDNTERQKRRDAIEKEYKEAIAKIDKDYDKTVTELRESAQKANERLAKYIDSWNTAEHNYDIAMDKLEATANTNVAENKVKADYGVETDAKKQEKVTEETNKRNDHKGEVQKDVDNNRSSLRRAELGTKYSGEAWVAQVRGKEARKTKTTPSAGTRGGGSKKGGSKKGASKKGGPKKGGSKPKKKRASRSEVHG